MFEMTMQRTFDMPASDLFDAWCKPEIIQKWFAPGNMTIPEAETDLREGGRYRIVMHDGDNDQDHIVDGEYQTIIENEKLVFTWHWKDSPNTTKVSLDFKAIDDNSCELTLNHSEFVEQEHCDHHEKGWAGCLDNLSKMNAA